MNGQLSICAKSRDNKGKHENSLLVFADHLGRLLVQGGHQNYIFFMIIGSIQEGSVEDEIPHSQNKKYKDTDPKPYNAVRKL